MTNNIVNIINFIRAVEPRPGRNIDLFEPVVEQMRLARRHGLPTTWLLQYDALTQGPFVDFLKREMPEDHEIGIWFEVVKPLAERAGIEWRGRYEWDWHTDVGFSVGYTPGERERLADVFVGEFRRIFGRGPRSMGSWLFDAHVLEYLHREHGVETACNCKDQYGTDGYTLWGGYWANAYYPSKRNAYLPARGVEGQIPVPVFRMLGSDPLYQYEAAIDGNGQTVITLEAISPGGGEPKWIDWFLEENFRGPGLAMAYAQTGQENSFGWPRMERGLTYQFERLEKLRDTGKLRVETLEASGRWFRETFKETPVSAVVTRSDWKDEGRAGVWYLSKKGRINLFRTPEGELTLRDWQLFDPGYAEPFLTGVCRTPACRYDALPVFDGMLWAPASFRFSGGPGEFGAIEAPDAETLTAEWRQESGGTIRFQLTPAGLAAHFTDPAGMLEFRGEARGTLSPGGIAFSHGGRDYRLRLRRGRLEETKGGFQLHADAGILELEGLISEENQTTL